jgi:hypothetical protein
VQPISPSLQLQLLQPSEGLKEVPFL